MSIVKIAACGWIALGLIGCASDVPIGVPPSDFGNAVSQNIASETVNPMAPADKGPIAVDARRAALELDRYLNDMVKPPANISTGVQIGGGSGSNNSGGTGGGGGAAAAGAPAAQ